MSHPISPSAAQYQHLANRKDITLTEYHPKGGLCMVCAKRCDDCSALPFASMPPLGAYQENGATVTIVRCTEFARHNVEGNRPPRDGD